MWVTRYRRKILVPGVAEYFKKVLRAVREFHPDWFIEEVGVDRDHVHLYTVIPPKYAVSEVVETKECDEPTTEREIPALSGKVYWDGGGIWARGFFASTVGINEATIRQYVRHQGSRRRVKRSLNFKETPPVRAGFFISGNPPKCSHRAKESFERPQFA